MAVSIFGAQLWQEGRNESDLRYDTIGKNSEVIAANDPLQIASGLLSVSGATTTVVGVAAGAATMASTNQTVAKITPAYLPISDSTIFLMGTNADLTGNATDGGTYYKLTGTTGAVLVDVTSGVQTTTSRVVEIVKVDPMNLGGTGAGSGVRTCLVRFVKTPYTNVSITA